VARPQETQKPARKPAPAVCASPGARVIPQRCTILRVTRIVYLDDPHVKTQMENAFSILRAPTLHHAPHAHRTRQARRSALDPTPIPARRQM
jgi:hypothetical protein